VCRSSPARRAEEQDICPVSTLIISGEIVPANVKDNKRGNAL